MRVERPSVLADVYAAARAPRAALRTRHLSEQARGQCGHRRALEVRGVRLSIHEWGAPGSPPALLLHSLAGHSHWWDWSAPLLAARFHVVGLDLRGHGGSDWVEPAAYRAADYVGDIASVLVSRVKA
jgi:alpha-beta hydrolase superfamily lysophospholipase